MGFLSRFPSRAVTTFPGRSARGCRSRSANRYRERSVRRSHDSPVRMFLKRSASKSRSRAARHSTNVPSVHNQPTADMIAPLLLLKTQSTVSPYKLNAFLANAPVVLPLTPYTDYLLYLILHNSTENR